MHAGQMLKCPTCSNLFDPEQTNAMPFCSPRCRKIDLGRWLGEEYGLPVVPDPEADEVPEVFPGQEPDEPDE